MGGRDGLDAARLRGLFFVAALWQVPVIIAANGSSPLQRTKSALPVSHRHKRCYALAQPKRFLVSPMELASLKLLYFQAFYGCFPAGIFRDEQEVCEIRFALRAERFERRVRFPAVSETAHVQLTAT